MKKILSFLFLSTTLCAQVPRYNGPIKGGLRKKPWLSNVEELSPLKNYQEDEYFFAGKALATSIDGHTYGKEESYHLRMLIKRPKRSSDFSGIVFIEWFNVSIQSEMGFMWQQLHEEILRKGHIYIGISLQKVGVQSSPTSLKFWDPLRYRGLNHPGDEFTEEILGQVGRSLKNPSSRSPLQGMPIKKLILGGKSQSGALLISYINKVHSRHQIFDGFMVDGWPGKIKDTGTPVMLTLAESELEGFTSPTGPFGSGELLARLGHLERFKFIEEVPPEFPNPDHKNLRVWEITGSTHIDKTTYNYSLSQGLTDLLSPKDIPIFNTSLSFCWRPINQLFFDRPQKAAFRQLVNWVTKGKKPKSYPRILRDDKDRLIRDHDGIALGGIRMPTIKVPIGVNRGDRCFFFGSYHRFSFIKLNSIMQH